MIVYRLTLPKYANDLNGTGSAMFGGRWNSIGNFLLYTAETSSLSILENVVHSYGTQSSNYILTSINLKDSSIMDINDLTALPTDWKRNEALTAKIGDLWVKDQNTAILKVPSVINPTESNFLINPLHPDLEMEIHNQEWHMLDSRLVRK